MFLLIRHGYLGLLLLLLKLVKGGRGQGFLVWERKCKGERHPCPYAGRLSLSPKYLPLRGLQEGLRVRSSLAWTDCPHPVQAALRVQALSVLERSGGHHC